jgi:hypothetical protein
MGFAGAYLLPLTDGDCYLFENSFALSSLGFQGDPIPGFALRGRPCACSCFLNNPFDPNSRQRPPRFFDAGHACHC